MPSRTDKIAAYLSARVTEVALERLRDSGKDQRFGIVSVSSVRVSPDLSYADVYMDAITHAEELPKLLAPIAGGLRTELSRKIGLHRSPIIRFRKRGEDKNEVDPETRVLGLLAEISREHAGT